MIIAIFGLIILVIIGFIIGRSDLISGGKCSRFSVSKMENKEDISIAMERLCHHIFLNCCGIETKSSKDPAIAPVLWLRASDPSDRKNGGPLLELDGLAKTIAWEYDGKDHWQLPTAAPRETSAIRKWTLRHWVVQRYNDRLKEKMCEDKKIVLIRIDSRVTSPQETLERYIKSRLLEVDKLSSKLYKVDGKSKTLVDLGSPIPKLARVSLPSQWEAYINGIIIVWRFRYPTGILPTVPSDGSIIGSQTDPPMIISTAPLPDELR
jgi:hypothetical protein